MLILLIQYFLFLAFSIKNIRYSTTIILGQKWVMHEQEAEQKRSI